jgi:8-oxo-dGTP pyrophosphatase MutT (NUDIX family)
VRTVYENPWIRVREYDACAPTGVATLYGVVSFKKHALGVLPVTDGGEVILVGQERFVFDELSWELPEGGGDPLRPALEGAQRELIEETGFRASNWFPLLNDVRLSNSVTDERAFAFLAWGLTPDQQLLPDPTELFTLRRVPFFKAVELAVSGAMTDAFSIMMLLKADHLARTGALPEGVSRLLKTDSPA